MAEESWPRSTYNGGAVTEAEYERLAARFSDDGLYDPYGAAPVVAGSGLQVLVQPELNASLRGFFWTSGASAVPLDVDANDGTGAERADWAVLRLDRSTWQVRAAIRKGVPGAGPPALVRDSWDTGVYEIPLGMITVPVGASSLTSANVTARPKYVGSRITNGVGGRDLNPQPGQLEWDGASYSSFNGTSWTTVLEDTGWVDLNVDWPTSWTKVATCAARKRNGMVSLIVQAARIGSYPRSDPDGTRLVTLPAGMRPVHHFEYFTGQFDDGITARIQIGGDGAVWLDHPDRDVPGGANLRFNATFLL